MADHEFGIVPHNWLSLKMDIPQHFVALANSNETDDISIHSGTVECNGAFILKGPRRDILCKEFDRGLEVVHDHSGAHVSNIP